MKKKNLNVFSASAFLALAMGVLFVSTSVVAENVWDSEKIEVRSGDKDVLLNAAKYSSGDGFNAYFYREPKGSQFEKVWLIFSLFEESKDLISSKESLQIAIGNYAEFDTAGLKESGEEFYWWSPRNVGVRLWDGIDHFPYGRIMEGIIEGVVMEVSYVSMTGGVVKHQINMAKGKGVLTQVLRIDSEIDPVNEERKAGLRSAYFEKSRTCLDFMLDETMRSTRQEYAAKREVYDSCAAATKTCLDVSNGDESIFRSCFSDITDM